MISFFNLFKFLKLKKMFKINSPASEHPSFVDTEESGVVNSVDQANQLYTGFTKKPPTLEEALVSMGYEKAKKFAELFTKKAEDKLTELDAPGLTVEDVAAIFCYLLEWNSDMFEGESPYRILNNSLSVDRSNAALKKTRGFLFLLLQALRKLPRFVPESHTLYRGIRVHVQTKPDPEFPERKPYTAGNEKTWWAFTSTTTSLEVTRTFLGKTGGTLFVVSGNPWCYNTSVFSDFPEEKEILLEPERRLRVTNVVREGQLITVNAEMLDTPLILEKVVKVTKTIKYVRQKKSKVKEVPKNLKAENITASTVELSWAPVEVKGKEVKYQVIAKKAGVFNKNFVVYEGTEVKYTVDNLVPDIEYVFRVRCGYDDGWGKWSNEVSTLTTHIEGISLTTNECSYDSIRISWDDKSGRYIVEMMENTFYGFHKIYEGEETNHTERGLTPHTVYSFRVRYEKDGKMSDWSDVVKESTLSVPSPKSLVPGKKTACSIDFFWTAISVKEPLYRVMMKPEGSGTRKVVWSGSTPECTISSLDPDTEYEFCVQGGTDKYWGDPSEPVTVKTPSWSWSDCVRFPGRNNGYVVFKGNTKKVTRIASNYDWDCTVTSHVHIPQSAVLCWGVKIAKSLENNGRNIYIGVAPSDIDQCVACNYSKCGWYFSCYCSTLCSGPPHNYSCPGKEYGPRKGNGEYVHTGDSVGVVMDTAKGELSFIVNGANLGVAYEGIPLDKPLVPCVILAYMDDSFELVSWHTQQ